MNAGELLERLQKLTKEELELPFVATSECGFFTVTGLSGRVFEVAKDDEEFLENEFAVGEKYVWLSLKEMWTF
jgi:hypothetical protein